MTNPTHKISAARYLIAAFLVGAATAIITTNWPSASAQQEFGPDNVKSVPKSFIEGGDRAYTTLKEIATHTKQTNQALSQLTETTTNSQQQAEAILKTLQSIDNRLKQIQTTLESNPAR